MNTLKYLSKLPERTILEILNEVNPNEIIQQIELFNDVDQELLIVTSLAEFYGKNLEKTYLFNDYQLLAISTPIDKLEPTKTNLAIESNTRLPIRRKTMKFIEEMNNALNNEKYLTDTKSYYESYIPEIMKIRKKNEKIIRKLQYKTFKGDYRKAVEVVFTNPNLYGFINLKSICDNNQKILNFIEDLQSQNQQ